MTIDMGAFKKGMRHLAASVCLITTRLGAERGGLTATAVCSVSAEPPQLLVCVNREASAHPLIVASRIFAVNVLAPDHRKIAERFAGMDGVEGDARFADLGDWRTLATGAPVLAGCPVTFDCKVAHTMVAGTHTIVIGEIVDVCLDAAHLPLLYADGTFVPGAALKTGA
jgi:flavin reductase (DIM6/NTAB) family NADH-FMN oxidoreductase RutF